MRTLLAALFVVWAGLAVAQTCIVPAPPAPPRARTLLVFLPEDGGTVGCEVVASGTTPSPVSNRYPVSNAKCAQAVQMASQALANDNGWNDGGTP